MARMPFGLQHSSGVIVFCFLFLSSVGMKCELSAAFRDDYDLAFSFLIGM